MVGRFTQPPLGAVTARGGQSVPRSRYLVMLRMAESRSASGFGSGEASLAIEMRRRASWNDPTAFAAAATLRNTLKAVELRWPVPSGAMDRPAAIA